MNRLAFPKPIKALILDMDGTLVRGNTLIPGLKDLFDLIHSNQIPYRIVTNNATKSPTDYQQKLAGYGIQIASANILTAGVATATNLQNLLEPSAKVYMIGQAALREALEASGFILVPDAVEAVEAVVVGGDMALTYEKLKNAALLLQRGARLVGTNPDLLYPTEEGLAPETGTTLAALQAATGVIPLVIGKPERHLFDQAIQRLGYDPSTIAMVGDRLDTDILGGQRAGLMTILTTTGVDQESSIVDKGIQPDWVVNSLEDLVELLGENRWKPAD
jgi:4-nitrophenyl phosphatase